MPNPFHLENRRKTPSAGRSSQLAFCVFILIMSFCFATDAVGQMQPVVSLSATSISPGWFAVGTTSESEHLWVTNSGNAPLTITSVTLSGANASDFALTNACGSSLAAGADCLISITFAPSAPGARTALLNITDNAAGSPQAVTCTGMGIGPAVSLSTGSLSFPSQAVGVTSPAQTITLNNTGNATLSISSLALTGANAGDFVQTNTCGTSVAAGNHCTISVTFTATAGGSRIAAVTLTDNAYGSPQTVTVTGTGIGPAASLSPTTLTFANQAASTTSAAQTITLTNTGIAALGITGITFNGTNATNFTEISTCGTSLAAGSHCAVAVLFVPSAAGTCTASLTVTDNAPGSPQTVPISGTGTHDVILSWTASATPGVVGYNIFRGTTSGGETTTPLNPSPITGTTYADASVQAGQTYYYVVTAIGSNGTTQSADSNEASANVPYNHSASI